MINQPRMSGGGVEQGGNACIALGEESLPPQPPILVRTFYNKFFALTTKFGI